MPVIEIKASNITNIQDLGIFKPYYEEGVDIWDLHYKTDLQKLNRFINIVISINDKHKGKSKYI